MPRIWKRAAGAAARPFAFPAADELDPAPKPSDLPAVEEDGEECQPEPPPPADRHPVDYAKVQAEAILSDARQQAWELLEQAKAEIADELEQLRAEAHEGGYRDGYADGMANAITEAKAQRESQAVELGREISQFLERATLEREALLERSKGELLELAMAVAEKVIRVSVKSSNEIIARMIQSATEKMKRKEWVHIYVAGCDTHGLARVSPGLTPALSSLSDYVKILPMADDESGSCIIETPDEIIDASVSTQLANIRDLLADGATKPG